MNLNTGVATSDSSLEEQARGSRVPLIAAVFANLLWGVTFLASKNTLLAWGPFTASALRFVLATIFVFIGAQLLGQKVQFPKDRRTWVGIFSVALTSFGFLYPLQLSGLQTISSGLSAAIMLTSPLFVVLFGRAFLGEKIGATKAVAICLGICGGVILISEGNSSGDVLSQWASAGSILTVLASISLAASVICTRKLSKSLNTANVTFWSMAVGAVLLSVAAYVVERSKPFQFLDVTAWVSLFFLSLVCSSLCFFIWNYAVTHASPRQIASTMHLKTPMAVLLGFYLLNEKLSLTALAGALIVAIGVVLSQFDLFGPKNE